MSRAFERSYRAGDGGLQPFQILSLSVKDAAQERRQQDQGDRGKVCLFQAFIDEGGQDEQEKDAAGGPVDAAAQAEGEGHPDAGGEDHAHQAGLDAL